MKNLKEYLKFAEEISEHAGEIMKKYYNSKNGQRYKKDDTIVTLADKEINQYLIERVKQTYPDHGVDGEEQTYGASEYLWVCDPVDGTAMFTRHVPVAVFSLALCVDGQPVVAVVNDVFSNCVYTAIKGKGAFKNGKKDFCQQDWFGRQKEYGRL